MAKAKKKYPESPLFIAFRRKICGTMGDVEGACTDMRLALDVLPDSIQFWTDYEFFLRQKGDMAGAEKARKEITRLSE